MGETARAPAPQKPTHHSSNSVLGWGQGLCPCHPHSSGKWPWCWASPREAGCVVSGSCALDDGNLGGAGGGWNAGCGPGPQVSYFQEENW